MPKQLLSNEERRHELLVALVKAPGKRIRFADAKRLLKCTDQNLSAWLCENADLDVYEEDRWIILGYQAALKRRPLIKQPLTNGIGGSWIERFS